MAESGTLLLTVRVQPGAKKDEVTGFEDGVLRVRLRAPAIEGRANAALCEYLAQLFDTAKTRVKVIRGARGRLKQVAIQGARHTVQELFFPGETASRNKKTGFLPGKT